VNYRTSLYDDDFPEKFKKFVDDSATMDVHDNAVVIARARLLEASFNVDGVDTRLAIIGWLLNTAAYNKQRADGTHEKYSTHKDNDDDR